MHEVNEVGRAERVPLLIVEDDVGLQKQLRWSFSDYEVIVASQRSDAIAAVRRAEPPVVLLDLGLPPDPSGVNEGMDTLREILRIAPDTKVIVATGYGDRDSALAAVSAGAHDFCAKPVDMDLLALIVARAVHMHTLEQQARLQQQSQLSYALPGVIATDDAMLRVCRIVTRVAPTNASALILGESGTGKEMLAQALHQRSGRKGQFIAINCAAIPETLLESELFGYERGAFTGAHRTTLGKIEQANGGTLFLDEVGDMPLALQAKLLRFLQARVIERIGGRETIPVELRVVCATNQDLRAMIDQQRFRQDLFFRIGEVLINVPPLRERAGGALVIAQSLLRRFGAELGRPLRGFTTDAIAAIEGHAWPGNVRELENRIKSAVILCEQPLIGAEDLGLGDTAGAATLLNLKEVRTRAERQSIVTALALSDGNVSRTAELLGVSRPTLYDLMEKYAIRAPEKRA